MDYQIIGGDNYNTLGMIRTLGEVGIAVKAIIIRGHFICASKSKYLKELKMVDTIEEGYKILVKKAKTRDNKQRVILLVEGDMVTTFLDSKYQILSKYYIYNQAAGHIERFNNKHEQVRLAEKYGLNVMKTYTVKTGEIPEGLVYPIITKATSSLIDDWKSEVHVCYSESELKDTYKKIRSDEIILQQFVKKKNEYVLDGYSINRGKEQCITIASTYNYIIPGEYAYSLTMKNFKDENLQQIITEMMTEIGYEGIYEFELLLGEDGKYYFLEVNLRNSGWSYASTVAEMPLPILWAKSMVNGKIDPNDIKKIKDGFVFIDDINDFKARVGGHRISLFKWIKEYKNADCRLTLGRNDIRPMITLVIGRAFGKIKRKLKRQ